MLVIEALVEQLPVIVEPILLVARLITAVVRAIPIIAVVVRAVPSIVSALAFDPRAGAGRGYRAADLLTTAPTALLSHAGDRACHLADPTLIATFEQASAGDRGIIALALPVSWAASEGPGRRCDAGAEKLVNFFKDVINEIISLGYRVVVLAFVHDARRPARRPRLVQF